MEERNTLSARSAVLSALLGSHPPRLPARHLVRIGALFGVAEGTVRVALSRMVAAGDLVQENGFYTLSPRLVERQARQDESRDPHIRPWDGTWEVAVVTAERRAPADRAALRHAMTALRLAELREGTWMRPANLVRSAWPEVVTAQCTLIDGRPHGDPTPLLWDLDGWAAEARRLEGALERADGLAEGFLVSAAVLRHLLADPLLPPELLPADWPGAELRARYDAFDARYREVLFRHLAG
ncbi:PaaX family transcriptional regulator C-terminal domain-containing protein [Nonomuraea sp. LP-02]|uniref:PaaX family transcriptional regulator C-terminal domain-containing protein n=1 Tax=Nonomuraea sp. LP-02 TaxID=3097960 RepID=UPI002E3673E0|nr:PaaX family transcriptional regulator C-terminal domain-containing protein [Nonomuraea sp. LP-02]MED7923072.1 PaaX family transcriptional regulator C-terminal domain-containing protein [Nonomuraea sp. LP-02]